MGMYIGKFWLTHEDCLYYHYTKKEVTLWEKIKEYFSGKKEKTTMDNVLFRAVAVAPTSLRKRK